MRMPSSVQSEKKMKRRMLVLFAFCSVVFTTKGLSLRPESDLTLQNFTLICNLESENWTSPVQFRYGSNLGGGCTSPPSPACSSTIGTVTFSSDLKEISLSLTQSNIASLGDQRWTCSHGTDLATYNATVIAVCSDGQAKQNGDEVDIRCSCGFPDVKATLKYKVSILQGKGPNIVDLQNSTGNCVGDSRAMDFIYSDDIPIGATELCVSFTTLSQISESKEECIRIRCTTTESTTVNLSTDVNSETSTKISTELVSPTQTSVSLSESTLEDSTISKSTESVGTMLEISTPPGTISPSGLSEEMTIIISTVSAVGGVLLIVIIVIVVLCCKQRTGTAESEKHTNKHSKLHDKNGNNKDLISNYKQSEKYSHSSLRKKMQRGIDLHQKQKNDILYGGFEYPRSQKYYQQNYLPRNQHHYRNQNSANYLPYTDPRNVMYYHRYPGSQYSEDMSGYSRGGPYRMQQVYPKSYSRQDRYTEDGLERRIGHRRGQYEGYWDDTLF